MCTDACISAVVLIYGPARLVALGVYVYVVNNVCVRLVESATAWFI